MILIIRCVLDASYKICTQLLFCPRNIIIHIYSNILVCRGVTKYKHARRKGSKVSAGSSGLVCGSLLIGSAALKQKENCGYDWLEESSMLSIGISSILTIRMGRRFLHTSSLLDKCISAASLAAISMGLDSFACYMDFCFFSELRTFKKRAKLSHST